MSQVYPPSNRVCAYPLKGKLPALAATNGKQIRIFNLRAANNSGSAAAVGLLRQLVPPNLQVLRINSGVFTDITTAVYAGTASPIFSGTINDGFAIQATTPPGLVGFTISTASAGGVFAYQYWNGTAFVTLPVIETPTDYSATGDTYVVFRPPYDWAVGGTGLPKQNSYTLKILSTTAPGGAISVNNIWVGEFLELYSGVATNAMVQISFPPEEPFRLEAGQGLFPYFGTANAANQFGCFYIAQN